MKKVKKLKRHPLSAIWPDFDHADLSADVARRGQDEAILLYQGKILDGWHRYLSALKEGRKPKFKVFKGSLLEAAERVHAANNLRRHMTADQRYACFLQLCKQVPEFEKKYEALRAKGQNQKAAGQPLATDSQRVNVAAAKAADAGVSPATAKKVERAARHDPKAVERIARGQTSANQELKQVKAKPSAKARAKSGLKLTPSPDDREDEDEHHDRPQRKHPPTKDLPLSAVLVNIATRLSMAVEEIGRINWRKEPAGDYVEVLTQIKRHVSALLKAVKK